MSDLSLVLIVNPAPIIQTVVTRPGPPGVGGGSLTVTEVDGSPNFIATTLRFDNGRVANAGGGVARISSGNVWGEITGLIDDQGDLTTLLDSRFTTLIGQPNTWSAANTFSQLILSGNINAPAWTTNGLRIQAVASTFTDTTSSGTVPVAYTNVYGGNTIAALAATTFTHYVTAFFREPNAGTNVTLPNRWALGAESCRFGTSNHLTISNTGVLSAIAPLITGQMRVTAASASNVPLAVRGFASQTGNLLEIQNSAGTVLDRFDSLGELIVRDDALNGGFRLGAVTADTRYKGIWCGSTVASPNTSNYVFLGLNDGSQAFTLFNTPSSSGHLGFRQNNANVMVILDNRLVVTNTGFPGTSEGDTAARATILTQSATFKGLTVRGFTGQTANLQEWQDATPTVVASISPAGNFVASGSLRIGGGTVVTNILSATATLDFPSIAANSVADLTMTVTNAQVGDTVAIGVPNGSMLADLSFFGWVSAANTVTIRATNNSSTTARDPASGTFRATVIRF